MSKKAKVETQPAKDETPKAVAFEVGQIVKVAIDDEVCFVGALEDALSQRFAQSTCAPLTVTELARYAIVTQQTTLGMGNIIDAVING